MVMCNEDMCFLSLHINVNAADVPGILEAKKGGVYLRVSHDGIMPHPSIRKVPTGNPVVPKLIDDPDDDEHEERFIIIGMSIKFRVLLVCHCYRSNDDEIRIISARKAVKHEVDQYKTKG